MKSAYDDLRKSNWWRETSNEAKRWNLWILTKIREIKSGKTVGRKRTPNANWRKLRVEIWSNDVSTENGRNSSLSHGLRAVTWLLQTRRLHAFGLKTDWPKWNHHYQVEIWRRAKWDQWTERAVRLSFKLNKLLCWHNWSVSQILKSRHSSAVCIVQKPWNCKWKSNWGIK